MPLARLQRTREAYQPNAHSWQIGAVPAHGAKATKAVWRCSECGQSRLLNPLGVPDEFYRVFMAGNDVLLSDSS